MNKRVIKRCQEIEGGSLGLQRDLVALRIDHAKTIALLMALKAGEVSLDEIEVSEDGWKLVEPHKVVKELPADALEILKERAAAAEAAVRNGDGTAAEVEAEPGKDS